jgi:[acyl-carrier-protein] S-malonyltransferase
MAKIAFLFPGQGAQSVGMGKDFVEAYPSAKARFEEASDILGWDVSRVAFEGPKEELDRTAICQPAILTTSLAIVAAMEEAGCEIVGQCALTAGLSLGEYSALVMAGAIKFADAVRLVQKRGQFMEDACHINPGTMMSIIGLENGIVEALCAEAREVDMVVAANYNSPGQVVISGSRAGIEKAGELAKERGAKRALPLSVAGAFHSPLMEPASERLEAELKNTEIKPCEIKLISNVTAKAVSEPDDIRRGLASQLKSSVRWAQSMSRMVDDDAPHFVEVGPGKVLSGLMRRIDRDSAIDNISTVDALQAKLDA